MRQPGVAKHKTTQTFFWQEYEHISLMKWVGDEIVVGQLS